MSRNSWVVRSAVRGPPALDDGVDRQGRVVHVLIHRRHLQPQTPHRLLDAPDQDRLRPLVEGDGVGEGPAHVDRNSHLPLLDRVLGRWPRPSLPLGPSPPPLALPTSMAGQELAQQASQTVLAAATAWASASRTPRAAGSPPPARQPASPALGFGPGARAADDRWVLAAGHRIPHRGYRDNPSRARRLVSSPRAQAPCLPHRHQTEHGEAPPMPSPDPNRAPITDGG